MLLGVLEPAPHFYYPPQNSGGGSALWPEVFIHPTIVITQALGKQRLISDMQSSNQRVLHLHFQMETLADLLALLPRYRYGIQLDIADAYLYIRIAPKDHTLLLIELLGIIYSPHAMLFGLTGAPWIWLKVTKIPTAVLRLNGCSPLRLHR